MQVSIMVNQINSMSDDDHSNILSRRDRFAVWMASINPVLDPWVC